MLQPGNYPMMHRPRKRFGQNFLQSPPVIQAILQCFHPKPSDRILEIGPGLGALTLPLLNVVKTLTAIEIDRDLAAHLQALPQTQEKLTLINTDALTFNYNDLGPHLRIIGNLPYNISTPLLLYLLQFSSQINDMHFMLQKEVVERLAAQPGTKAYGRLSVAVQYRCEVEQLFTVPPSAFHPQPKVESAIVRLTPYKDNASPYPFIEFKQLENLMTYAFSMRRKTLANNLKPLLSANDLTSLHIDPRARPEQISITDYVQIAKFLNN
jgi:16S rRNA (adenine1518-N6/adenine1519-N6)-dimethyltransferase